MSEEVTILNPYEEIDWRTVEQAKAQFHTHTNRPKDGEAHNGSDDAHVLVDFYEENGFSVLTLGDHENAVDAVTWPWTDLSSIESDWEDRYPLGTHDDAKSDDTVVDLVAIKGIELGRGRDPEDMVSLFNDLETSPSGDNVRVLEEIANRGGIAWLSHPSRYATAEDWGNRWWQEALMTIDACLGFEVYNPSYDKANATAIWDTALSDLLPDNQAWAFAGDDMHNTDKTRISEAWQTILVEDLTQTSIRSALKNGETFIQTVKDRDLLRRVYAYGAYLPFIQPVLEWYEDPIPPQIQSIDVDYNTMVVEVNATNYDAVKWISNGTVVGTDSVIEVNQSHVPYLRAVLMNDNGETSTQPFTVFDQTSV